MADGFHSSPDLNTPHAKRRSFSVAELDAMFDAQILSREEKIELIDGEIIQVNSQMMPHSVVKFNLAAKFLSLVSKDVRICVETTVQLDEATLVDPDVCLTPKRPVERRYLRSDELLLALEIADTSLTYDLGAKANLYARAQVPELWVVDINGKQTHRHRDPSASMYQSIDIIPFALPISIVLGTEQTIILDDLLA
jgi:Uma2 family endonuclease